MPTFLGPSEFSRRKQGKSTRRTGDSCGQETLSQEGQAFAGPGAGVGTRELQG